MEHALTTLDDPRGLIDTCERLVNSLHLKAWELGDLCFRISETRAYAAVGYRSLSEWVRQRLHMNYRDVMRFVALGRWLGAQPLDEQQRYRALPVTQVLACLPLLRRDLEKGRTLLLGGGSAETKRRAAAQMPRYRIRYDVSEQTQCLWETAVRAVAAGLCNPTEEEVIRQCAEVLLRACRPQTHLTMQARSEIDVLQP